MARPEATSINPSFGSLASGIGYANIAAKADEQEHTTAHMSTIAAI
jgi:hypothetical protein